MTTWEHATFTNSADSVSPWKIALFVAVVFGIAFLLCLSIPKARADEYPYLSTRPKEEVCVNWAQNAAAGAVLAAHDKPLTDDLFGPASEHPDADAWVKKGAHAGYDWIKDYLKTDIGQAKKLPGDQEVFEHVGSLAYNACISDPDSPGIASKEGDDAPKTEL